MTHNETDAVGQHEPATDDLLGDDFETTVAEAVALGTEDFDHRLLFARVSTALFNRAPVLRIGRYKVESHLGEGGMGQVYLCHDESLDRKVAIKRVRGHASEIAQARLRREAVALARLSHDNVVQVYDSGEHEGHTYVAMEYVQGPTLRDWMDKPHSRREVLELFLAAGQGLAAAHAAGLVHRDFKPENVLIDGAGKPKVADFGLAWGSDLREEAPADKLVADQMTAAGAGTRQYMPLEQILGESVGPRSDQFAFCVTLYEALWGEAPFVFTSFAARTKALEAEPPKMPPDRSDLFRVIGRGLARDPEDRWADMDELLHALERITGRRRRLATRAVLGLGLSLGLGVALAVLPVDPPPRAELCPEIAGQLDDVWHSQSAVSLDQSLAALDAPHAARSRELLYADLDRWSKAWIEERSATCHALHDSAGDPGRYAEATARDACLSRQKHEVATLVGALVEQADADMLGRVVVEVSALPAPSSCTEAASLDPEPLSPALRPTVVALRAELARAHQLRLLGRRGPALTLITELESKAHVYEPLFAQVLGERGRAEEEAGAPVRAEAFYRKALELVHKGGSEALEAELELELAELSAFELANLDIAQERYWRLEMLVRSQPNAGRLHARLAVGRGRLAELGGDRQEAAQHYQTAIESAGEGAAELPAYYTLVARVAVEAKAAGEASRLAYEYAEKYWGAEHPRTAEYMLDHGMVLEERLGEIAAGAQLRTRATTILAASGVAHDQALVAFERARAALIAEDWEAASEHARDLARLQDEFLPPEHPERGQPESVLVSVESARGHTEQAIEHAREAIRFYEADPTTRARAPLLNTRSYLVNALMEVEDFDGARQQADAILQVCKAGSLSALAAQLGLVELAVREGAPTRADELLADCALPGHESGENELVYAVLRALTNLRLAPPRPIDRDALERAWGRHESFDLAGWLEQLGATRAERNALGH